MKNSSLTSAVRVLSLLLLVSGAGALAQDRRPVHFSGLINDYSPANVKGGPWEMHGQWTLELRPDGQAESGFVVDFSADMTMSGYGSTKITANMDGCPTVSPATLTGFHISDTVSLITGNGTNAPFENPNGPPVSTLQVCITGGDQAPYSVTNSNISLVFGGPATSHFGTQAIHGVVRNATADPIVKDREFPR
jgi:hypothetical protein